MRHRTGSTTKASRRARALLAWLLAAMLPWQALATAGMALCGANHGPPAQAAHAVAGAPMDLHAGHAMAAADDGPAVPAGHAAAPHHGAGGSPCSHCAACFATAAPPPAAPPPSPPPGHAAYERAPALAPPSFLTPGPDRPPRALA